MINQLIQNWKRASAARDRIRQEMEERRRTNIKSEWQELLTQSIVNVRYIKASLNTLRSNANTIKGDTAGETRRKRESVRKRIEWLEGKLTEEAGMVEHFSKLLGKKV